MSVINPKGRERLPIPPKPMNRCPPNDGGGEQFLDAATEIAWTEPHSRACGIQPHAHGRRCQSDCPTCGGNDKVAHGLLEQARADELPRVTAARIQRVQDELSYQVRTVAAWVKMRAKAGLGVDSMRIEEHITSGRANIRRYLTATEEELAGQAKPLTREERQAELQRRQHWETLKADGIVIAQGYCYLDHGGASGDAVRHEIGTIPVELRG